MKVVEAIKNGAVIAEKVEPGKTIKVYTKSGCNMSDSDCPYKTEKPATPKKENRSGEDFHAFANRNGEPDNSISWALQNRRIQLKAEMWDSICGSYLVDEYGDKYPQ